MDLRNKKVVVLGLGASGFGACSLLLKEGAIVSVTDSNRTQDIEKKAETLRKFFLNVEVGSHSEDMLRGADMAIISPGISSDSLPIRFAMSSNIPVISELELGFQCCKAPIIAVTGTNGKSTVCTLLGDIFKKHGRKTIVCGNIGYTLSEAAIEADKNSFLICEVSSYQLERVIDFRPLVSCILNISPDHLDRHGSMKEYAALKYKIFRMQRSGDTVVLNHDDPSLKKISTPKEARLLYYSMKSKVCGIFYRNGWIVNNLYGKPMNLFKLTDMKIRGPHNIENILAAVAVSLACGINIDAIKEALFEYAPLPHRMQTLDTINDIEFIDDSKATNIDATKRALEAMTKKVILIAGGRDKGGDYSLIKESVRAKVKEIFLIGESSGLIQKSLAGCAGIEKVGSLEEATVKAFQCADPGDAVLLSPMCSSFDMFRDFNHRGDVFRNTVSLIRSQHASCREKSA